MNRPTGKEMKERLDRGMCVNGCNAPICPPSKVICRGCLDKITGTLKSAVLALDEAARRAEQEEQSGEQ